MRQLSTLLLLVCGLTLARAHDELPHEGRSAADRGLSAADRGLSAADRSERAIRLTQPEDRSNTGRRALWGPTGELLPPVMATRALDGEDYFEWCLRWNKRQHALASERAVAPRTVRGWVTNRSSYSNSSVGRGFFGRVRSGGRHFSTTRSREQVWHIGGYGGGPVTLYNPFVPAPAAIEAQVANSN